MCKWTQNHQGLQKMSCESEMYDVDQFTTQLHSLLTEQWSQVGNLIESVNKLQTGLAQLKLSVNELEGGGQTKASGSNL